MKALSRVLLLTGLALAALPEGSAAADTWPRPGPPMLDEVVAAFRAKDAKRLEALALREAPNPWFVADELLARGEKEAAAAFARAAPSLPALARLPDYVDVRWDVDDGPARRSVATAEAALRDGPEETLWALRKAEPFGDDMVSLRALNLRAVSLRGLGREAEAQATLAEAAQRAERLGAHVIQSDLVGWSGEWALQDGDFRTARARFERTIALREQAQVVRGVNGTRLLLATALEGMGEYEEARRHAQTALARAEEAKRPSEVAAALGILGTTSMELEDIPTALGYGQRALDVAVAAGDRQDEAATLGNMATAFQAMGDLPRARDVARRSLAIFRDLGDRPNEARSASTFGSIARAKGDYVQAFEQQSTALEIGRAIGDREVEAGATLEIGHLHTATGDAGRAETAYLRVVSLAQAAGARSMAASALDSLGSLCLERGEMDRAAEYFERALRTHVDIGDRVGEGWSLISLASLAGRRGDAEARVKLLERASAIAEEGGATSLLASALQQLGDALRVRGDEAAAITAFERAIRVAERARLRGTLALAVQAYAAALLQFGKNELALAMARRAVAIVNDLVKEQSDEKGATTRTRYATAYDVGLAAASRTGNVPEASYFLEAARAGSLLEALENRADILAARLTPALAEEERRARAEDLSAQAAYRRAVAARDRAEIASRAKAAEAAEDRLTSIRQRIQQEAKMVAEVFYPEPATVEEIRGLLHEQDALVLYGLTMVTDEAFALVVTRKDARLVALGRTRAIEEACGDLVAGKSRVDPTGAVAELRRLVVTPLALPAGTRRVLLSPDGSLSYAPLALLFGVGPDDPEVCCMLSGTGYATLRRERPPSGQKVLALGDPEYASEADPRGDLGAVALLHGGPRLPRLPATREEAQAVGDVVLLGAEATVERLRAALAKEPRWRAVHLACHGLLRTDKGMLSSLALTPSGEDGGMLTAADVFSTWRVPADLVVLSACETSRGAVVRAEGIYGLTRAFMFAGAPRVIVSLWKVDDAATSALMKKLYVSLKAGTPPARALRDAQAFVRSQDRWKHPAYWAGWVLWGLPD